MTGAMLLVRTLVFFAVAAAASFVDLRTFRIPDLITFPAMAVLLGAAAALEPRSLPSVLAAAGIALLVFGSVFLLRRGRLGGGDVKLSVVLALATGVAGWFLSVLVGTLAALLYAGARVLGGSDRATLRIPFAPFLALGGLVSLVLCWVNPTLRLLSFEGVDL